MVNQERRWRERGATAIIVVVFCVLLLVTISVGFMRMVVQDQLRSQDNELSRGAYDSALAGVEDAKRVLEACEQQGASSAACQAINDRACSTISTAGFASETNHEVKLRTTAGTDGGFDQAYTCVTIEPDTTDYRGALDADGSRIIPLETTGSFNRVRIMWFKNAGLGNPVNLGQTGLRQLGSWSAANSVTPPLLRAQLIMYRDDGFTLKDFDSSGGGNTLYLYPKSTGSTSTNFALDPRPDKTGAGLVNVKCNAANQYVCSVDVQLPHTVDPTAASNRYVAYLRLTALYGPADFVVEPLGTQFSSIQPAVDSTGRASNVFRRVSARVERTNPNDSQLFPRATVDITHNFCKSFGVTVSDPAQGLGLCSYTQP